MKTFLRKTFYFLAITTLLSACKSDDIDTYLDETYFIDGEYAARLSDNNLNLINSAITSSEGIYGFLNTGTMSNRLQSLVHITTDGSVETLLTEAQYNPNGSKYSTVNLFLQETKLFIILNIQTSVDNYESQIFTLDLETKEYLAFKTFTSYKDILSTVSYDAKSDLLILGDETANKLFYYPLSATDNTPVPFTYSYANIEEKKEKLSFPILSNDEFYSVSAMGNIYKIEIEKVGTEYICKPVLFSKQNDAVLYQLGLQVTSNGDFYCFTNLGLSKINTATKKIEPKFYDANLKPKKYTVSFKNNADKYYITTSYTTKHKNTTPFEYPVPINSFLVIENSLYVLDQTKIFKINNFEKQFNEAVATTPKI
ncbi:hypothetical protein [Flavobacterium sp. NKUCC04_CG]|uniref:hypothetical protein n=1 Tax=Flavobacterium sp. NKUCC04_CG TaxID=2842121 RepID=UPI001C5B3ED0|nr:hypothetical protein [Flavobacterium sp. NKUCC04_CG]MBW3520112.1 hypothetical protein [Flavobacterium sp. NKUCC04_CG]